MEFTLNRRDSWSEAMDQLIQFEGLNGHLYKVQIIGIGELMQKTNAMPIIEALKAVAVEIPIKVTTKWMNDCAAMITKYLPVMFVQSVDSKRNLLVNIKELYFAAGHDTLADLLLLATPEDDTKISMEDVLKDFEKEDIEEEINIDHYIPEKPGRKPFHQIYPNLVQIVLEKIEQHGYSAQARRRTEV